MTKITNGVAYLGLLSAAMGSILLPKELSVQTALCAPAAPAAVELSGAVRDFRSGHPDFEVIPDAGFAHYADMVEVDLGAGGVPVLAGSGAAADPVAFTTIVKESVLLKTGSKINGHLRTNITSSGGITLSDSEVTGNVTSGAGSDPGTVISLSGSTIGGTTGAEPGPIPFDPIVAPSDAVVGPDLGDMTFSGGGETIIDSHRHYSNFRVTTNSIVRIQGDVTIFAEGDFTTETGGSIIVDPGGSLKLYTNGAVGVKTKSAWSDPVSTTLYVIGDPGVNFETESEFFGTVVAPEAHVLIKTKSAVRGSLMARSLQMETQGTSGPADAVVVAPAATPAPYRVDQQWRNAAGDPIAPHLASLAGGGDDGDWGTTLVAVRSKLTSDDPGTIIDGYNAATGTYGGANAGQNVIISSNSTSSGVVSLADTTVTGDVMVGPGGDPATAANISGCFISGTVGSLAEAVAMPTLTEPAIGASVGDVTYENGTFTLGADVHGDKVVVSNATLIVTAHVTMLVESELKVTSGAVIEIQPGASLTVYGKGNVKFENGVTVNDALKDPRAFDIRQMASNTVKIDGASIVHAVITAPDAAVEISGSSQFYGRFRGDEFHVSGASGAHLDTSSPAGPAPVGCLATADVAGLAGTTDSAGVDSADSFAGWFHDTLGANVSLPHTIRLTNDGTGVYEYLDDTFHPADGLGFGHEGAGHNRFFTFSTSATFVHEECAGQFVEFTGADDFWLYIDGKLVMDIGGVGTTKSQVVEIDRLGLTDGETYAVHLFYAQRTSFTSTFRLRTNLLLSSSGQTTSSAPFD